MKPKSKQRRRIYSTKVVHCQKEPFDILIDRTTPYGNPWSHLDDSLAPNKVATRREALNAFKEHLESNTDLQEKIRPLKGKTLGCWCKPDKRCHGDIIAEYLDRLTPTEEDLLKKIFGVNEDED